MKTTGHSRSTERTYKFDPQLAGKTAECDGGRQIVGGPDHGPPAVRESYRGKLTGLYWEEGDPIWRWYELLIDKTSPDGDPGQAMWCEEGFLFIMEVP